MASSYAPARRRLGNESGGELLPGGSSLPRKTGRGSSPILGCSPNGVKNRSNAAKAKAMYSDGLSAAASAARTDGTKRKLSFWEAFWATKNVESPKWGCWSRASHSV
eukprot:scaffold80353_cov33-Tisochrysis_lutea.AAC.5